MRAIWVALVLAAAACTPPAAEAPAEEPPAMAEAPAVDLGPYTNNWDAAEFSNFRHTLHAVAPGAHTLTLQASTDSPGGETVAIYPIGPDGAPSTARIMFVVATTRGETASEENVEIPAEGLPVAVVVENASGRRYAGAYTITVVAP